MSQSANIPPAPHYLTLAATAHTRVSFLVACTDEGAPAIPLLEEEGVRLLTIKAQKEFNKAYTARCAHLQSEWNRDEDAPPLQASAEYTQDSPAMAAYAANGEVCPCQPLAVFRVS